jgi:ssRNA-specific RNase YbeY (16S rRNA maturation enzyme)
MLEILNKTKNNPPIGGLFVKKVDKIKKSVLGKNYDLSLVLIGDRLSSKLNLKYRNKKGPTDVLSFSLGEQDGEIFINLDKIKKETKIFKTNYRQLTINLHSFIFAFKRFCPW